MQQVDGIIHVLHALYCVLGNCVQLVTIYTYFTSCSNRFWDL